MEKYRSQLEMLLATKALQYNEGWLQEGRLGAPRVAQRRLHVAHERVLQNFEHHRRALYHMQYAVMKGFILPTAQNGLKPSSL